MPNFYNINKPYQINNWHIFPRTVISNMDLNDCDDTVNGICEHTDTLEKCINMCKDSKYPCESGYFIETENKNYCVPLRSYGNKDTNMFYRLRKQDYYSELEGTKSTFFIKDENKYPPDISNTLFYQDSFKLKNIKTGFTLGFSHTGSTIRKVQFDSHSIHLQFLPESLSRTFVEKYVPIKNGDKVVINIPRTSFVLRKNSDDNIISWQMKESIYILENNTFTIFSSNSRKKIGEPLTYDEEFYFKYFDKTVFYNSQTEHLEVSSSNIKESDHIFKLIPRVEVYYCEDKECKSVSLSDTDMKGQKARYKNQIVHRNPSCWGLCENNNKNIGLWITVGIGVLAIISFIVLSIKLNKNMNKSI